VQKENGAKRTGVHRDDYVLTGPGTTAGDFLRGFWNPVYHSADLKVGRPIPLVIMSEQYTLYRGESGDVFLTQPRCPHRGTQLSTAWVEGDALRCFYHGWKFGRDGRCMEQPAEESSYCDKVPLRTYPVREYLGLVFAYLGDGIPPEFPTYPQFENFAGIVEVDSYVRYCNYFQNVENSLDMSHVAFTHGNNTASFATIGLGKALKAEESPWGITYTFTRDDGAKRVQQFGMPNIFYMTALPNDPEIGWQESLFWWVPIDDETHMQFSIHRVPATGSTFDRLHERRQKRRTEIDLAHQDVCDQILNGHRRMEDFDLSRVDVVRLQDDIAQLGQGIFANRNRERMGKADIGVAVIRRLWRREMDNIEGKLPLKSWQWSPEIRPTAWNIPDSLSRVGEDGASGGKAEIVDIRPFVEVDLQLKALHGTLATRGAN
jgi:5,5'-dehydrodivanillate O-demethylase